MLAPPREPALWDDMRWCSAVLQTTGGEVAVSWRRANEAAGAAGAPVYFMDAAVPVNARASIVVPTVELADSVTVFESGIAVWTNGSFQSGVVGVESALPGADGRSVALETGSGNFSFTVAVQ